MWSESEKEERNTLDPAKALTIPWQTTYSIMKVKSITRKLAGRVVCTTKRYKLKIVQVYTLTT